MKYALMLVAVGLFVMTLGLGGGVAAAAGTGTLVIHARQCPSGQPTTDLFADCHRYPASRSDKFAVTPGASKQVDRHGNVTFRGLGAGGPQLVAQTAGQFENEFLGEQVWCSTDGGAAYELTVLGPGAFVVYLAAGETTTCDVYFIPDGSQSQPAPAPAGFVAFAQPRVFHAQQGALGRSGPSRGDSVVASLRTGTGLDCDGYVHGQSIGGDDRWVRCHDIYIHTSGLVEQV